MIDYVIRVVTFSRWDLGENFDPSKLNDIDADPIGDLRTDNNELSVYIINDIKYIKHIAIAFSCNKNRKKFEKFEYVIAEKEELEKNDISMICSPKTSNTPDNKANERHYNLVNLKAQDLVKLAKIFLRHVNTNENKGLDFSITRQKIIQLAKSKIDNDADFKKNVNSKLIAELNQVLTKRN